MKKLLSILGSLAVVGGASATIVACGSKAKETPKEENPIDVAKGKLADLIKEAQGLVSTSKKEASVTEALQKATNKAQSVLEKENVTEIEIIGETATLQTAIDVFNQAKDRPAIDIAKDELVAEIAKAEKLVKESKKEASVTEALQAAIDEAKEALNDEEATENSIRNAKEELTKAIDKFNEAEDLDKKLQDKIDETKKTKAEIENENNQNGWDAIAEKSQKDFDSVIKKAEEVVKQDILTKEEVDDQFEKLDASIENFKSSLPQQVVSEAINARKDDIKNLVFKNWSYASFFNAKEAERDGNVRLVNLLIKDISELTKEHHYTEAEQTKLNELIIKHFAEKVKLVYLHEQDCQQKIKNIIDQVEEKTSLEKIFLDNVSQEFPDADLKDPSFWEKHPKLSLGIKFGTENLNPKTKEFWTFTFANDITANDKDEVQKLFREAEARDGGRIILNVPKGLSKHDGSFTGVINAQLQKKVFYGIRFISHLSATWTEMPNDKQVENGVEGWKTSKNSKLNVNIPWTDNKTLFSINTTITINIR